MKTLNKIMMVIGWYVMANFTGQLLYAWYVNISKIYG